MLGDYAFTSPMISRCVFLMRRPITRHMCRAAERYAGTRLCLRACRVRRAPRARTARRNQSLVTDELLVSERPAEVDDRAFQITGNLGAAWDRGVPGDWLNAVRDDWRIFDTDGLRPRIDAVRQPRANCAGQTLHLVHDEGRGPSPVPLLLTHRVARSFLQDQLQPRPAAHPAQQLPHA
jgi:Epoxide hydrolase N terminus